MTEDLDGDGTGVQLLPPNTLGTAGLLASELFVYAALMQRPQARRIWDIVPLRYEEARFPHYDMSV